MRKKCVLWAKPVLATLAIIFAVGLLHWSNGALSAQSSDPMAQPRLAFSDFTYLGGFRLPRESQGGDDFSYGGLHMAFNPANNSLFVSSLHNNVAEVSIPTPGGTSDVNQMPFASYLQGFGDPSEGHFREVEQGGPNGAVLAGLVVHGDRLYATGSIYYDAMNSQVVSHFSHSTNLTEPSFRGMSKVWEAGKTGYVAGYMANIPSEWQDLLGGPVLTGQCCISIIGRTSFGPAAFGFDPTGIGRNTALSASPLLYYPGNHPTLGPWEGSNPTYGATTLLGGTAVIAGSRTVIFIGRNGLGTYCYGHGVSEKSWDGTKGADGETNCYDPASSDKGMHAYPYRYQIWAYDLADFAAVKAGTKQPWDVVPYATWPFDFPTSSRTVRIGGVAYDAQRQLLYVGQYMADPDGYAERAIVHVLKVNAPSSEAPAPQVSTTNVTIRPNVAPPQAPGTVTKWTADVRGGQAPYQYKWAAFANGNWTVLRDWSPTPNVDWQPKSAAPDGRMAVWVRNAPTALALSDAGAVAASAEYPFAIVSATAPTAPVAPVASVVSNVVLTTDLAAPQPAGSTIVWTATPAGVSGSLVYKWFVSNDGGSWTPVGSWTPSNKFPWTPANANPSYAVSVWVKGSANPADAAEVSSYRGFPIGGTPSTSSPVASVSLTASMPSPQAVGTTIVWTASANVGGALLYKWFVSDDGGTWKPAGTWSASNQFSWTPTVVTPGGYQVSVWVKRASNPADSAEASTSRPFKINKK